MRPFGNLAVLSAAVLWGTTGTAQALAPSGATPASIGSVRIVLGGLILLSLCAGRRIPLGKETRLPMAVGALCVAAYQLCYFAAVARTGVAVGTVVTIGSGPIFAGLLARLTGHEPLTGRWMAATACAIAGGGVLLLGGGGDAEIDPTGVALALASGFGYATYTLVSARLIGAGLAERTVMGGLFGGAAIVLLPVLVTTDLTWAVSPHGLLIAAHLGLVTTAVGYLLYARGLRTTPVTTATTLVLAEPAVAALLGVIVVGERLGGAAPAGLVLIGAGLLILAARPVRD